MLLFYFLLETNRFLRKDHKICIKIDTLLQWQHSLHFIIYRIIGCSDIPEQILGVSGMFRRSVKAYQDFSGAFRRVSEGFPGNQKGFGGFQGNFRGVFRWVSMRFR